MSYGTRAAERLAGKTILITGASSGIGSAIANELADTAKGNVRLILVARRLLRLAEIKKNLESKYPGIEILPWELDISDFKRIPTRIKELPKDWSKIDVLINNAGMAQGADLVGSLEIEAIESVYSTNVIGLVVLTNLIVAQMKERNKGDIVMIGSISAYEAVPTSSLYGSSKACLLSFTEALRKQNISNRLRIIEVDPGLTETEFALVKFEGDSEKAKKVYSGYEPLTTYDIADVVVFNLTRAENTVVASTSVVPNNQASCTFTYRQ